MIYDQKVLDNKEGTKLQLYKWSPEDGSKIIGLVQIAHGMAEWAGRYEYFAKRLTNAGYIVYANDHRGHGHTAVDIDSIGYLGKDSFNGMVRDLKLINDKIKEEYPGLPIFLFGHSMGSFLAQSFITKYGDNLSGVILSGSNGKRGFELDLGILIARLQMAIRGEKAKSKLLDSMTFGAYNKSFKPQRTSFDWLSGDHKEVDKYINDPYCGGVFTTSFFYDFFRGLKTLYDEDMIDKIPIDLPIFILSGSRDPVGDFGEGVSKLARMYRRHFLTDVILKLYEGDRHELLNELNKDEVIYDIIEWLDTKL